MAGWAPVGERPEEGAWRPAEEGGRLTVCVRQSAQKAFSPARIARPSSRSLPGILRPHPSQKNICIKESLPRSYPSLTFRIVLCLRTAIIRTFAGAELFSFLMSIYPSYGPKSTIPHARSRVRDSTGGFPMVGGDDFSEGKTIALPLC